RKPYAAAMARAVRRTATTTIRPNGGIGSAGRARWTPCSMCARRLIPCRQETRAMAINVEKFADEVDAKIGAEEAQLVRDLQFKLETSQVALKGAEERAKMLLDAM